MCKVLINEVVLGKRLVGYECYSMETKDIVGLTAKQVKDILAEGKEIKGFKLNSHNEVEVDRIYINNYMIKSGIGSLTPKYESDCIVNLMYTVVGRDNNGYEVVSSRFFHGYMKDEKVKLLYEMGAVNGVTMFKGEIYLIGEDNTVNTDKAVKESKAEVKNAEAKDISKPSSKKSAVKDNGAAV